MKEQHNKIISALIKKRREEAGVSAKKLGEKIGMSTATIFSYEGNRRTPSFEILAKIADALNIGYVEGFLMPYMVQLGGQIVGDNVLLDMKIFSKEELKTISKLATILKTISNKKCS